MTQGVVADPAARLPAGDVALDRIDVSDPRLYRDHAHAPYFARLRREDPVHYCADSRFGPYWSVTRYKDIVQVDVDWQTFSSDYTMGGIQIRDAPKENVTVNFIRMDPPRHDEQRKTVSPIVAPANLLEMESLIRERTREVLDGLPRNEVFDWVDPRVDRADDADAGDAVRLSVRGPPPAHLLVGRGNGGSRVGRADRHRGEALRDPAAGGGVLQAAVRRTGDSCRRATT